MEGGGGQGERECALESTACTWSSNQIGRSSRALKACEEFDTDVVKTIVAAVHGCTVVEGDIVKTVLFYTEVNDLVRVVVAPIEVILSQGGLQRIYRGSLSEVYVKIFVAQTHFNCIKGQTVLNAFLELNGRSDKIVVHTLTAIGVEVWIVSSVAKEVGHLPASHIEPSAAIGIVVDDGKEVPVFLSVKLLNVVGNPGVAINDFVGSDGCTAFGHFTYERNNLPRIVVVRGRELVGD